MQSKQSYTHYLLVPDQLPRYITKGKIDGIKAEKNEIQAKFCHWKFSSKQWECIAERSEHLPLNKITEIVVDMDRLILILPHRQPAEPERKHLIEVDLAAVVFTDLCDGRDGILCGVDILLSSRFRVLDHFNKQWQCLCKWKEIYNVKIQECHWL